MSESGDRPPVRSRSGRRPIPPLIFLLVLALAALGVWWNVLRDAEQATAAQAAACTTAAEAAPALDPASLQVRVFNATDSAGLAQTVAATLQSRGFVVTEVANDTSPLRSEVQGVGALRYGPRGAEAARYLEFFLPSVGQQPDTRADSVVDLVIGPEFTELATPEQVAAALAPVESAEAAC